MHIVIAVPPVRDFYFTPHRFANLGVEIATGILRSYGHTVRVFNFPLFSKKRTLLALPVELEYLRPFIIPGETGPLSFFRSYQWFGPGFTECARLVAAEQPDMVFVSCFAFAYAAECLELAAAVRQLLPRVPLVAAGAGVSAYPQYFLGRGVIDYCLRGEAETTLPEFLNIFTASSQPLSQAGTPGSPPAPKPRVGLLPHTRVPLAPRLSAEPSSSKPPAGREPLVSRYRPSIFPPEKENRHTMGGEIEFSLKLSFETSEIRYYSACLSRGCARRCRFCSLHLSHGPGFRTASFEKVASGIQALAPEINQTGKQIRFNFEDDNLLLAPVYFIKVLTVIRRYIPRAVVSAENGLDYTLLTPDMVRVLAGLGFRQFNLSLGSASAAGARREDRILDTNHYQNLLRCIASRRLPCITYFICGLMGDTVDSIASTLAFLTRQPTQSGISLFYAVPGLPDFQERSVFDSLPPILCKGSAAYPWNKSLSTQIMVTAFRLSRLVNLMHASIASSGSRSADVKSLLRLVLKEKKLYTLVRSRHGLTPLPVDTADRELVSLFFGLLP